MGASAPIALPVHGLDGAGGVAVDSSGDVYVASYNTSQVLELPAEWAAPSELAFSGLNGSNAVAVDAAGNVYASDPGNDRVLKLASTE
jgi:serine/threonine-protein kinase